MQHFHEANVRRDRDGKFASKPRTQITQDQIERLARISDGPSDPDSGIPYETQLPCFVYGTLRPGHGNYHHILRGHTQNEETGSLDGMTMWSNGSFPYVAETDDGGTVTGTLIDISSDDWHTVSRNLDALEGFSPDRARNHYVRTVRNITLADGTATQAWVYLAGMTGPEGLDNNYPRVTTGDWEDAQVDWSRVPSNHRPTSSSSQALDESDVDDEFCIDCGEPGELLCEACEADRADDDCPLDLSDTKPCAQCGGTSVGGATWHTSDGVFRLCRSCDPR